jgi:NAD(P)H-binding
MKALTINQAVALVTGANRGIGRALTEALLTRGVKKVYATARDPETLRALSDERLVALRLDVTDADQIRGAAEAASDVELLTEREEQGCDECTRRHIMPAEMHIGQDAVEESEQRCRPDERYEYLDSVPHQWDARGVPREPCAEGRKSGGHRERDHQQKANRDHQSEGAQTINQEGLQVRTRIRLHTPHRVQCGLELEERTGRGDDECDAADRGGDDARPSLTRSIEKALYGARTLAPD